MAFGLVTMIYYALKFAISAAAIVLISEIAKRSSSIAALVAALPLTSLLAFVWLHFEGSSSSDISELSSQVFWLVLPSLVLFLLLPFLLKQGFSFWFSLLASIGATVACYLGSLPLLRKVGVNL